MVTSELPGHAVLDGAVGTELVRIGLRLETECPERWNHERPEAVRGLHAAYFRAGAHAVATNTFSANRLRLAIFGRAAEVRSLNIAGALLAREVRPTGKLVMGSMGPTGQVEAELSSTRDAFAEQASALAEGGVDLVHLETACHPGEARAALAGIKQGAPGLPVIASMTCVKRPEGYFTVLGYTAEEMLHAFLEHEVDAVGANCSLFPKEMAGLVALLCRATAKPVVAQPVGSVPLEGELSPEEFGRAAVALFSVGARAVGGCCGTGPTHIAALARESERTVDSSD